MTISTLLMMLALAVGSGANQAVAGDPEPADAGRPPGKIASHCWINGTYYNPCPQETGEDPPPILPPAY